MRRTLLALMFAGLLGGALFGLSGCYATGASVGVGVEAGPPAPVAYYDGYGYGSGSVWIDGHWAWTEVGWRWYPGYWVAARPGFVYVQGYWDYWGGRYLYRPGSWARYRHGYAWIGGRWRVHRSGYHHYDYRRGRWVSGGSHGYRRPPPRDHRTYRHRDGGGVRDHRDRGSYRRGRSNSYHRRR